MGCNCFKASTPDDISLLRGIDPSAEVSESSGHVDLPPPPPYVQHDRVFLEERKRKTEKLKSEFLQKTRLHLGMDISQPVLQLSEDEQIKIAKRIGLINHLPWGIYEGTKKVRECAICMGEFVVGDKVRYLPCVHTYHCECIDDWLMRSLTCPSCMEPVDSALLTSYDVNNY